MEVCAGKVFWQPRYAGHSVSGWMLTSWKMCKSSNAQPPGEAELANDMTRRLDVVPCPDDCPRGLWPFRTSPLVHLRWTVMMTSSARISNGFAGTIEFCRVDGIRGGRGPGTHARQRQKIDSCRKWNVCQTTLCESVPLSSELAQQPNASKASTDAEIIGQNSSTCLPEKPAWNTEMQVATNTKRRVLLLHQTGAR